MNKTLKLLVISDIFVFSGWGLIAPIFAIFVNENLIGGSITAAGIASAIFLITHSILQIIFAKIFNPKDRFWMLITGTSLLVFVPFFYIFSKSVAHIYIAQFIYGVGAGFAYPSWSSLFTSNLEKGKRGLQWSIYSSSVGIGTAITAYLGAVLADLYGFKIVFAITGSIAIIGLLILFKLDQKSLMKKI
ncbi:MAG: MFS transporter [Nanoarchaeota archaeon]|nr:MFS transporter [Nanoarchaeota archaeon]